MATKKRSTTKGQEPEVIAATPEEEMLAPEKNEPRTAAPEEKKELIDTKKHQVVKKSVNNKAKFNVGDIVFINRDTEADLEGFKLFPQYKKYSYTVEAYDGHTGVYTLRRLNLSLKLKEAEILAPNERAHDPLNRTQY